MPMFKPNTKRLDKSFKTLRNSSLSTLFQTQTRIIYSGGRLVRQVQQVV